ncbi:glycoside hydrolase family 5 protein [Rhizobium sp. TRM95796]|uniref:glycoside hydrolase family 5 protein n=1 Tax=Rhizobium sp. TRM95796 TaxID=2979862 RepID=UPI0021E7CF50|nr:glycoside hydrolase family 5 protein [Rhizobium sp. TRM95796]MCV3766862.1 glycoside hydrolase family 5 protein [Rhizobium sp. TRM95796]
MTDMRMMSFAALALAATFGFQGAALAAKGCFRGINLSGAEFGELGGKVNKAYVWPSDKTVSYFAAKGFDTVRLPFMWERLQPKLMAPFDPAEEGRLRESVELIKSHGMRVILDPHNYARYQGKLIGSPDVPHAAFADFWVKLATLFANDPAIYFGLMNEPNKMPVAQWVEAANAATLAIRLEAKAGNLILAPGTAWTGAHSWMKEIDGEPNGVALLKYKDPSDNFAFEVHQYLDDDFSGTKGNCSRADDAVTAIKDFTKWLKSNGFKGFLGEFGAPGEPACVAGLQAMIDVVEADKEVWTGWTYWVAGDWWSESEPLNIQPTANGDRPQLAAMTPTLTDFSAEGRNCPSLR